MPHISYFFLLLVVLTWFLLDFGAFLFDLFLFLCIRPIFRLKINWPIFIPNMYLLIVKDFLFLPSWDNTFFLNRVLIIVEDLLIVFAVLLKKEPFQIERMLLFCCRFTFCYFSSWSNGRTSSRSFPLSSTVGVVDRIHSYSTNGWSSAF